MRITPIDDEETPSLGFSSFSFYDDNDATVPRAEYEPTQPSRPFYEPTGVVPRK